MLNLSTLKTVTATGEAREFRASLVNGKWVGIRNGKSYPINVPKDVCNTIAYIFSSPTNDKWPIGTPRKHEKLNVDNYLDYGYWSAFREGFKFNGIISRSVIMVDWKDHQKRAAKEYGKALHAGFSKQS